MSLPDFLCIGAQKSGTSWLSNNLQSHPELWLPPAKELHYFDRGEARYISMLSDPDNRSLVGSRFRRAMIDIAGSALHPRIALRTAGWYYRFLFQRRNDEWYRSLFKPGSNQVAGEVCPGYAPMSEDQVRHVGQLLPQVKIVYLLRNPIERLWSAAAMHVRRNGQNDLNDFDSRGLQKFLGDKAVRHSSYAANISLWERTLGGNRNQIFIGFFEQIANSPRQLLSDIFRFLGVSSHENHFSQFLTKKIFASPDYPEIPQDLKRDLSKLLYPELVSLHERVDNHHTKAWLASAEASLD